VLGTLVGLSIFVALLGGHHHGHGTSPQPGAAETGMARISSGLSGVGMPTTLPGNVPVRPLRIVVVLGGALMPQAQAREIHALEGWLSGHVNPATRLTVVADHRITPALRPSEWTSTTPRQRFSGSLSGALKRRLAVGRGHRVLVTLDRPYPLTGEDIARLRLVLREGADLPTSIPLRPGGTLVRVLDPNETQAIAATIARAIISMSRMTEGAEE